MKFWSSRRIVHEPKLGTGDSRMLENIVDEPAQDLCDVVQVWLLIYERGSVLGYPVTRRSGFAIVI
jgi:hypothetical protein